MPLLFARNNEIGKDRDHRAIHRHGDRNLIERYTVKEDFHILNTVNRDPGLADIALYAGMIAVIAAVGGQIKGHRNALLPRRQCLAVERIRFFCGRKPRILPDRPGAACIHRRLHTARERGLPGDTAHMRQFTGILGGIKRLHWDAFQRIPCQRLQRLATQLFVGNFFPCFLVRHRNLRREF